MKNKTLSLSNISKIVSDIRELVSKNPSKKYYLKISEKPETRSLPANRVYQSWYPAMSEALAMTIPEATRYIKLTFGLPILFSDNHIGAIMWHGLDKKGFFQLSYEQQLLEMERIPVTRLFDTKMHNKLRQDLQSHFGAMGYNLDYDNDNN